VKLGFIGGGVMGEAIIAGVLNKGLARPADIAACDVAPGRRDHLAKTYGVRVSEDAATASDGNDLVLLAVKPQEFPQAGRSLAGGLNGKQTVMSIMAGVTVDSIRSTLRHDAVIRAIPNTPAQIGEGMTVWTATNAVAEEARENVRNVLSVLGRELYVADEKYVDMATAVSSSGPAYVFLVIEALIDAAVHIGLRREMAAPMVLQTVLGSARYALETGKHPAELRNQVTSPGGTTTEGLLALEEAGVRAAFIEAVEAAYEKTKELGGQASKR
jgi:pyrroline-5-carboxylate reductase